MKAELVIIGNEITQGFTVDTNSAFLGRELGSLGCIVGRKVTVGDDPRDIREAVAAALRRADLVICTGGLGPTCDDITKKAVAKLFTSRLVLDKKVLDFIEARFTQRGIAMPTSNVGQAMVPDRATVLHNAHGTAPGLLFARGKKRVALLPGVPHEVVGIWRNSLKPLLEQQLKDQHVAYLILRTFGIPESQLAEKLGPVEKLLKPGELAYNPGSGGVDLRLTFTGKNRKALDQKLSRIAKLITGILGAAIYGRNDDTLASVAGSLLRAKNMSLTVAESCTGGLIGDKLTDVPGSSDYFLGGAIVYSNALKQLLLGVPGEVIRRHGAVSRETAAAMALGVRKRLGSDVGVAVTGIAGPAGGSAAKPVGLVYIAVAGQQGVSIEERRFLSSRRIIKELSANAALNVLRLYLQKKIEC